MISQEKLEEGKTNALAGIESSYKEGFITKKQYEEKRTEVLKNFSANQTAAMLNSPPGKKKEVKKAPAAPKPKENPPVVTKAPEPSVPTPMVPRLEAPQVNNAKRREVLGAFYGNYEPKEIKVSQSKLESGIVDTKKDIWIKKTMPELLVALQDPTIAYHVSSAVQDTRFYVYRFLYLDFDSKSEFSNRTVTIARKITAVLEGIKIKGITKFSGSSGFHFMALFQTWPRNMSFEDFSSLIFSYIIKKIPSAKFNTKDGKYNLELKNQLRGTYSVNYNSGKALFSVPLETLDGLKIEDIFTLAKNPEFKHIENESLPAHKFPVLPKELQALWKKYLQLKSKKERYRWMREQLRGFINDSVGKTISFQDITINITPPNEIMSAAYVKTMVDPLVDRGVLERLVESRRVDPFGKSSSFRVLKQLEHDEDRLFKALYDSPPTDGRKRLLALFLIPYMIQIKGLGEYDLQRNCEEWIKATGKDPFEYSGYIRNHINSALHRSKVKNLLYSGNLRYWQAELGDHWKP